jgi:uridine kinase
VHEGQRTIDGIHAARDEILAAVAAHGPRVVIGVTGAVASGKSTLARALSPCIVSTDHYLPDYDATPEHLRDLPESSDLSRLAADLAELRAGRATCIPRWSFDTHSRVGEQHVEPASVIVVEGLHALHALPRAFVDLAVYIDAPRAVRWERAAARERAGDRPWPLEYLEHFFHTVAEPTYARHADAYRASAHFVVRNPTPGADPAAGPAARPA